MLIQNSVCNYGLQCTENVTCKIRCQNKEQHFEGEEAIKICLSQLRKRNQIKIYKNAMEMYRKKLKIKTSK
jgi:hypothetical protein